MDFLLMKSLNLKINLKIKNQAPMKRFISIIMLAIVACSFTVTAQNDHNEGKNKKQWLSEMKEYKHKFLSKELELTPQQEKDFFVLYDELGAKVYELNKDARQMAKNIKASGENVTELEYEKAAEAMFEVKWKESELEKEYFEKFKTVLTKKQLFLLKGAEMKFNRDMMKHHNRLRHKKGDKK